VKHLISFAIPLLLLAACSRPLRNGLNGQATSHAAQTAPSEGQITYGSEVRHYLLHVPTSYQAGVPVPLVLNFHGLGSTSSQEESITGMSIKADNEGFIVVYPDGLNAKWATGPGPEGQADLQFIRDLIAALEGQYNIDPKRIYATGISNGGGMTNRLGCNMADLIAAIAPDSGAYNFWQDCSPTRPVPVLAFHGLDDGIVPYNGGESPTIEPPIPDWAAAWAARDGCSATPSQSSPVEGVTVQTWSGCQGNAEVILYTLANHGHSWPGSLVMPKAITSQAVNATNVMWDFFMAHPMP
jgi:polyhydroxybutyrate depolymerase